MPRRERQTRKLRPTILVLCEGPTEREYVHLMRRHHRPKAEVRPIVEGTRISQDRLDRHMQNMENDVDRLFVLYDTDKPDTMVRINMIDNATKVLSYPCMELWFLLHFEDHRAYISSDQVKRRLRQFCPTYRPGEICRALQDALINNYSLAKHRAESMFLQQNPSSLVYMLVDMIRELR